MSELRDAIAGVLHHTRVGPNQTVISIGSSTAEYLADAVMALIEQSRPSREEFTSALDEFQNEVCGFVCFGGYGDRTDYDATRKSVMRMAGFPEER